MRWLYKAIAKPFYVDANSLCSLLSPDVVLIYHLNMPVVETLAAIPQVAFKGKSIEIAVIIVFITASDDHPW